jgi:HdeA/HdeB family
MRCRFIGLTFAIAMAPVVANAQLTIDMGKITCGQYLAMPPSQSDNFSAWMSKKHKADTLPTAVQKSAS